MTGLGSRIDEEIGDDGAAVVRFSIKSARAGDAAKPRKSRFLGRLRWIRMNPPSSFPDCHPDRAADAPFHAPESRAAPRRFVLPTAFRIAQNYRAIDPPCIEKAATIRFWDGCARAAYL